MADTRQPTLEEYLRREIAKGAIDFHIRAQPMSDGVIGFYIHPYGKNGDTVDYSVIGNTLGEK